MEKKFARGEKKEEGFINMNTLVVSSCVRGYHIYQDTWFPVTEEELFCQREPSNIEEPHAVAILKDGIVAGLIHHVTCCHE